MTMAGDLGTASPVITAEMVAAGSEALRSVEWELFEQRFPEQITALVSLIYKAMRLKEPAR